MYGLSNKKVANFSCNKLNPLPLIYSMTTNSDINKKWSKINHPILFLFSTPVFISISLLYVLWGTATYDATLFKIPGCGPVWSDPKYHIYYDFLSPWIVWFGVVAFYSFPVIMIYYIVLFFKKKYINKLLFFVTLLFYIFLAGNIIFVETGGP